MKALKTLISVLLIVAVSSCGEDFLDIKPSNSGDAGSSIQTPADAKVIMNGLMSKIRSSAYYGRNFIMYANAKGGDLTIFSQGRGLDGLYTFNHSVTTGSNSGFWNQITIVFYRQTASFRVLINYKQKAVPGISMI